jgi:hypothetical protein
LPLYEAALCHFLEGAANISVNGSCSELGVQPMQLAAPNVAFVLTAFKKRSEAFGVHATRLLQHTTLETILWVNMTCNEIRLETIQK